MQYSTIRQSRKGTYAEVIMGNLKLKPKSTQTSPPTLPALVCLQKEKSVGVQESSMEKEASEVNNSNVASAPEGDGIVETASH